MPNWPPYCFIEKDRTLGIPSELLPASKLVKNQASLQGPSLPDWQLENILPSLASRAELFIHQQSQAQTPFLLYLPLTSPHTPLAVNSTWKGKSGLQSDYADLVMETDEVVGRVLQAIRTAGVEDNTFVLFTSDNGCANYIGVKEMETQGHYPSGPLRDYKTSVYEGGHRVPYVIRWPGVVRPGTVCNQLVLHADLIATMAEIFERPLPPDAGEDSFSLMPLLQGGMQPIRSHSVNTACNGLPSYREGHWKYVAKEEPELYNLEKDLRESENLAAQEPARVQAMQESFEKIIRAGRSTPGPQQKNDIKVVRYPKAKSS
ncbi:MAG: sulfatase-like hydrolase/transferase [Pirellulales bacterium]